MASSYAASCERPVAPFSMNLAETAEAPRTFLVTGSAGVRHEGAEVGSGLVEEAQVQMRARAVRERPAPDDEPGDVAEP